MQPRILYLHSFSPLFIPCAAKKKNASQEKETRRLNTVTKFNLRRVNSGVVYLIAYNYILRTLKQYPSCHCFTK